MTGTIQSGVILRHLRTLVATENGGGLTDRQLLEQFATQREEAAFTALVRRYGPLVLGVCRRVLRHEQDAEDAFQATFLILARKARNVGRAGSVAGWLHRVAYHAAIKARERTATRSWHERQAPARASADPLEDVSGREFVRVLDEELQRLSESCRAPLVLCYLEGHTCDQAARLLGCSLRTLKRRLEQGRQSLRRRLARRGITLPAALLAAGLTQTAKACVPAVLAAATAKAAMETGSAATTAGAVAEAVLHGMAAPRFKILAAILALGTLVFGIGALAPHSPAQRPDPVVPKAPPASETRQPAKDAKDAKDAKKSAIRGRVVDPDGQPVAGAVVAGHGSLDLGNLSVENKHKSLGEVKTDADGRFALPVVLGAGERMTDVELLAGAKGYGPAWGRAAVSSKEVELRLVPEAAGLGRLIDLQGLPADKVKLRVVRVLAEKPKPLGQGEERPILPPARADEQAAEMAVRFTEALRHQQGFDFPSDSPSKDSTLWPKTVTTDAEGRFRIGGFGKGQDIVLVVEDDHFARQEITVKGGAKETRLSLLPPFRVTGRVVAADTGKPIANAGISIETFRTYVAHNVQTRTDAEGRYSANAYPGDHYSVGVYPSSGQPYLAVFRSGDWPKGAVKREVDVKLPRGTVVRGKVVEMGSDKAILSASVAFVPQRDNNSDVPKDIVTGEYHRAWTAADGSFEMVLPAARGQLVVLGPNADYTYRTITEGELQNGKVGGKARHFHAVMPLEIRKTDASKDVKVELRRCVTIKGKVVDQDGKPIKDGVVFMPSELLPEYQNAPLYVIFGLPIGTRITAVRVRDGVFELPNCDPDKTYRVYIMSGAASNGSKVLIIEPRMMVAQGRTDIDNAAAVVNQLVGKKDMLGAVVDLAAPKAGGKPLEVKLAKCESAEVRFVDAKGKPVAQKVWLEMVMKPTGEGALLATPYSLSGEKSPVAADAEGRININGLVPGASYRLKVLTGQEGLESEVIYEKEFTVEGGKTIKLELKAPAGK